MKTILFADDEESLRILVLTTLEDLGYRLQEACDGEEALQMARAGRPDLILLDWMMPGKTGVQVTAELRRDPSFAATPIILLTARSQQDDIASALETGVSTYLTKPFSPLELVGKVQEFLAA